MKKLPRRINEIGNRHGNLIVIGQGDNYVLYNKKSGKKSVTATWICRCDCGNTTTVRGRDLRHKQSRSCGKCMPLGEAAFNACYNKTKDSAVSRNYNWSLTKEQFRFITSQPCTYCGKIPNQTYKTQNNRGGYIHNGIDRMNNEVGYVIENCVPCCKTCNYAKRTMTIDSFINWIASVYTHFLCPVDSNYK